jgi:transposase-like protein
VAIDLLDEGVRARLDEICEQLDLIEAGRKVADVVRDVGINHQTVYAWRRQERIAAGKPT